MPRLAERAFNPVAPVLVRRFFVAAGRHWNPGDLFDWQRLSIAQRRVRQLYDAGKLMHPAEGGVIQGNPQRARLVGEVPSEQTRPAPKKTIEDEIEDTSVLAAAAAPEAADTPQDELDEMDMKELRAIAEAEGAPFRVSREAQRQAIRENRE